ncbi:unnamed protein product [Prunus armeniaca]
MTVWRTTNPDARDFPVDMGFTNLCIAKTSNSEQKIATTKINRDGYEIRYKKRGNISSKEEWSNLTMRIRFCQAKKNVNLLWKEGRFITMFKPILQNPTPPQCHLKHRRLNGKTPAQTSPGGLGGLGGR